jgi:type VI secretion system protein ImpK
MKLVDCFIPLMVEVMDCFGGDEERLLTDADALSQKLEALVSHCLDEAAKRGFPDEKIRTALLAVAAFADEKILESQWRYKSAWAQHLLQQKYFNTSKGGVEFFSHLERLNVYNPVDQQVREVYFYCLSLGFSGQYYRPGDRLKLQEIKASTASMLCRNGSPDVLVPLSPRAAPRGEPAKRRRYVPEGPLLWGIPLLVIMAAYTLLRNGVFETLRDIVSKI